MLLTSKGISRSQPSQETERQKSSDILEELRMQGIIKSQSTTEGMYEHEVSVIIWDMTPCYSSDPEIQLLHVQSIQAYLLCDSWSKLLSSRELYYGDANATEAGSSFQLFTASGLVSNGDKGDSDSTKNSLFEKLIGSYMPQTSFFSPLI